MKVLLFIAFSISTCFAVEPAPMPSATPTEKSLLQEAADTSQEVGNKVIKLLNETRDIRTHSQGFVLLNYSPIDLIIPSKIGLTAGLISNADATWELEYLRGTMSVPFLIDDLGEFRDERFSLIRRSYLGSNSFNISYGLSYFRFRLKLGNDILSRIPGGNYPAEADYLKAEALGFNLGIGNRWSFDNKVTFSVDWLSWAQPLFQTHEEAVYLAYATNSGDRENADDALKFMRYFPRLALFKVQLGILF